MAQNPSNAMSSKPGSANPSTKKGAPHVASQSLDTVARKAYQPIQPSPLANVPGSKKPAHKGMPDPQGVRLGTTYGNHDVTHASRGNLKAGSIQKGK